MAINLNGMLLGSCANDGGTLILIPLCADAIGLLRSTSMCRAVRYVPGSPSPAKALLYGVLLLKKKIHRIGTIERGIDPAVVDH